MTTERPMPWYKPIAGMLLATLIGTPAHAVDYEVWAADQSNSVAGEASRGVNGSLLWIWDSADIERYLAGTGGAPVPLDCDGGASPAPCDMNTVFPASLTEFDDAGPTGETLGSVGPVGRLHGALPDPQHLYVNINLFSPGQGFVGIMDGRSKEAVALFRVTGSSAGRSVHMSFWNNDGSALLIANLNGKILERIDLERDANGNITAAKFNQSASLGVGKGLTVDEGAKAYLGNNGAGRAMIGEVVGAYTAAVTDDLTPNGKCKENGCDGDDGAEGGRPNNVIICPIVSSNDKAYVTLGGGGLIVADVRTTPMTIVGEYGNGVINGAGCGGIESGGLMHLNAGVSASDAGATQSTFTMYRLSTAFPNGDRNFLPENRPRPRVLYRDPTNTATGGAEDGPSENDSGQLPGVSTRRDAHGAVATFSGHYVHNVDRIQNNVEVFNRANRRRTTYDLTSADGLGNGLGPCAAASVTDDPDLPLNDPAPDLMDRSPNRDFLYIALRGPVPVSVTHSAQGSCPGVGIVEVTQGGKRGRLVGVLRTTNVVDTAPVSAPGGHAYVGRERSDPHGVSVRIK